MKKVEFHITLVGSGRTVEAAWDDAREVFLSSDRSVPANVEYEIVENDADGRYAASTPVATVLRDIRRATKRAIARLETDWDVMAAHDIMQTATRRYKKVCAGQNGDRELLRLMGMTVAELKFGSPEVIELRLDEITRRLDKIEVQMK